MKIAISSGKGGTGKTTLSVNLASYWSETDKVVLIDLDVEEPNSGLFLKKDLIHEEIKFKMVPQWNRNKCENHGTCSDVCNFNAIIRLGKEVVIFPELCHSCYACVELCPSQALNMIKEKIGKLTYFENTHLSFIESKLDIGQEQAVPLISQTKEYVDEKFNHKYIKIYDSPPGTSCPVIESIKNVDFVILVTEPTPFGLHDLKITVDVVKELKKDFAVVINRYGIGNNDTERYCDENNIEIIAKIPNNRKIAELYSNGDLIYDKIQEFTQELERIKIYLTKYNR
jgi:MinD superfamily P-loop ATPase